MSSIESVLNQLQAAGLIVENLEIDSKNIVRVKVDGDKGKSVSGWYRVYSVTSQKGNIYYVGVYGNWKNSALPDTGQTISYESNSLSTEDLDAIKRKQQQARKSVEAERKAKNKEAAGRAVSTWEGLGRDGASPYLSRKKVGAFGVRFSRGTVVVPVVGVKGDLLGLQFIYADGNKRFLTGTAKKGAFHLIGTVAEGVPVVVTEGYATAASIHMATQWPVVVAFDAGNLPAVAKNSRSKFPEARLIIAADNDDAGRKYGKRASENVGGTMALPVFNKPGEKDTDFNDLHVAEGLEKVAEILNTAQASPPDLAKSASPGSDESQKYSPFTASDSGVYYLDRESGESYWICSRLDVIAETRNTDNSGWGLLVRLTDGDGITKEWNIPTRLFNSDNGNKIIGELLDQGLKIDAGRYGNKRVLEYLKRYKSAKRTRLVDKLGWFGNAYLMPGEVVGSQDEAVHYYSNRPPLNKSARGGSMEAWRDNVSVYCRNNPLLMFATSTAFAGPMLELLGVETFGVHIVGDSSLGKSTAARVAASVCGGKDYLRTWHTTSTALEVFAAEHSDSLLILDEINQSDPHAVGQMIYMLGNASGKARGLDTATGTRPQHHWRLLFLSNGERSLEQHLASAGKKQQAGMDVRLLNVGACIHTEEKARKQKGIYEDLHSFAHGAALSDHLSQQSAMNYGHAHYSFVTALTAMTEETKKRMVAYIRRQQNEFEHGLLSEEASGQARRAAAKFALIGIAGELATKQSITGWSKGEALEAAQIMFQRWLSQRGGEGSAEDKAVLEHICLELQNKGESHFTRWDCEEGDAKVDTHQPRTGTRWGFRRVETESAYAGESCSEELFYIYKLSFRKSLCKGFDYKRACELLKERGALEHHKSRGYLYRANLPGSGKSKEDVYLIKMSALRNMLPEADCTDDQEAA